jgi:hypothetical protein
LDGKTRKDNVGREIFRRLFFVWDCNKQVGWLKYEHLLILLHNLREVTKTYVDIVPNNNIENITKRYSFDFKRSDFEDGWVKISKVYEADYSKYLHSNLKDIELRGVNITAPNNWTFDKQILLLKGLNISDVRYSVWHKVFSKISPKFEKLLADNRWIVLNNKEDILTLHHSTRGSLIDKIDVSNVNIELKEDQKTETTVINNKSQLVFESLNSDELQDLEIINSVDFLKKEVSFFICSDSKFKSSIFDSWNNVLNEIRLHYAIASKKEKLEWIRRLDTARQILEEEIDITHCDMYAYETYFSLLTKRIYELMRND